MKNDNEKLRREISKRWPLVGYDTGARAQLEYILQEAGLLVTRRKRRKKLDERTAAMAELMRKGEEAPRHVKD